jgi:uncharacterized protein (DUF488 family)
MSQVIYSIGHSNGTIEQLIGLLQQHSITAVADVRSQPYSRFNPQFNREVLASSLKRAAMEYVFLGQELGARSDDPACYRNGRAQYSLIAKAAMFQRGNGRLLSGAERFRLAILCAEKEPLVCQRGILISRHLHENGIVVRHILEDGSLEDPESAVERLLDMHGLRDEHLFHSRDERIALAYEKQAEDIQYAREESQPA